MSKGGMKKGGPFEREVCRLLSEWWTEGRSDDCFWRSSGSGARATVRGKKGKKTTGHSGDITCASAEGQPLTDLIHFELKRGYSRHTVADLLDCSAGAKKPLYAEWMDKADASTVRTDTPYWMLIVRRDRRDTLCFFPEALLEELDRFNEGYVPDAVIRATHTDFVCDRFGSFLLHVSSESVRKLHELLSPQKKRGA
jgi:hypothetical protein